MPFSHVDAAPRWFAPNVVTDALLAAILEGERLCRDYPELEAPDPAPAALRLAFGEVGDPARILHGVALHLGRSPLYGWCGDERLLLASLGQLFASLPAASRGPVVVAAAARLWRLRSLLPTLLTQGGGKNQDSSSASIKASKANLKCPNLEAFMAGAARQVPASALPSIRKQIDRQIAAAPGRERVGARWAAFLPLAGLIELGDANPDDVAAAFSANENPQRTLATSLEPSQVRRRLAAAKRSRVSRQREANSSA